MKSPARDVPAGEEGAAVVEEGVVAAEEGAVAGVDGVVAGVEARVEEEGAAGGDDDPE